MPFEAYVHIDGPYTHRQAVEAVSKSISVDPESGVDCVSLAGWDQREDQVCVSSPNMPWIPEIPTHRQYREFSYYADGMLGPFELMKWPQVFDAMFPHALAAPANPKLIPSAFLPVEKFPKFEDKTIPWLEWDNKWFCTWLPGGKAGIVHPDYSTKLEDATAEAALRIQASKALRSSVPAKRSADGAGADAAHTLAEQLLLNSQYVHDTLMRTPLSLPEVVQWFREGQRLLLELRALIIYMEVVKPRIDDPLFKADRVLPVRGVITEKMMLARTLHRVGVPVWLVRPAHTITHQTAVLQAVRMTPWSNFMSNKQFLVHGDSYQKAPAWIDAPSLDAAMEGLGHHIRKFSLSSRPLVRAKVAYGQEDAEEVAKAERLALEKAGRQADSGLNDLVASPSAAGTSRRPGAPAAAREHRGKPPPGDPARPKWLTPECDWLARVIARNTGIQPRENQPFLYNLPPAHIFFASGGTQGQKMHLWLLIRPWCISQTIRPPDGGRVLLTTTGWRIALEGRYHQIAVPSEWSIQPNSSAADIKKLPPDPRSQPAVHRRPDRRAMRRVCDRVDINVRFGVQGGFKPYQADLDPLPEWGSQRVSRADADSDERIWAEAVWELSSINFRLELLAMDRLMNAKSYSPEADWGRAREHEVMLLWEGDGRVSPMWDRSGVVCGIDAPSAPARLGAFIRWARIMNAWPAARGRLTEAAQGIDQDKYEAHIAGFYSRQFYEVHGRMPTFPVKAPSSLARHL
ncbi:hypothetical protein FA95DRAFT_1609448 [Auriscalpium vulgare]|uniref:Uncharacterized protein n=1 Tax=Auriscalpium vulgare TaxID=40419 RepID=A0ACB8RHJ2_9AGAM|nr:hypothetical protein FA95DRAFT_1609448 [Auriscalpium vulgare]